MRSAILATSLAGLVALAAAGLCAVALSADKPAENKTEVVLAPRSESAAKLPVARVVLFNSGVAYFQREGDLDGDARIDLAFPVQDVNDLLKSLVVQDDKGTVSAVALDSQAPVEKTLRSFALDLSQDPTLANILHQARGEKVEVVLPPTAPQPGTLSGAIVGLERQRQPAGKDSVVEVEQLNLWCADGLRQVKLADVQRVRFLNPVLDAEFKKALEVVTLAHDAQKKAVSLSFRGEGMRRVKVGYVVENPVWKTSYRLVLDQEGKPHLQGWAVVENTTDEDWNGVRLALVSGRPISFQMDLYEPLYVPRPVVEPELFASLRPPTYSGALDGRQHRSGRETGGLSGQVPPGTRAFAVRASTETTNGGFVLPNSRVDVVLVERGGVVQTIMNGVSVLAVDTVNRRPDDKSANIASDVTLQVNPQQAEKLAQAQARGELRLVTRPQLTAGAFRPEGLVNDFRKGVAQAATALNLGDSFQYVIDQPVTLGRQKSAMIPLVNKTIEATRVSIFNEQVHTKFPLLGVRLKNDTGQPLIQGPVTVFDQGAYAGDARILDLQPKEERLLSYAIDLGTEVRVEPQADNGVLTSVKIQKGVVHTRSRLKEAKTYTLKNRSDRDRVVLVEHPNRPEFKLTGAAKPAETARDVHRFEVRVPKGETVKFVVAEERDLGASAALTNFADDGVQVLLKETVASPEVKEALQTATQKKWELAKTRQEIADVRRELEAVKADQPRLRSNLEKVPGTDPLAKRLLDKLNQQETQIEGHEAQLKELNAKADLQRKDYEEFLAGLTVK